MISKKNLTTIHKSATLFVVFMLVFGANIASAQNYTDPLGPPPGNNAPAPIHEGTLGQGKYWNPSLIPSYSIGAMFGIFDGLLSNWIIADGAGVAATQFCLGTAEEIDGAGFHEDGSTAGLNCVTDTTGWPGGGGDGGGGDGGGGGGGGGGGDGTTSSIPDGDIWHQLLYYSNEAAEWKPLPLTRIMTPLEMYLGGSADAINTVVQNGLPLPGTVIEFGSLNQVDYNNPAEINAVGEDPYYAGPVQMTVTGAFSARNQAPGATHTLGVDGNGTRVNGPFRLQHVTGESIPLNNILATTNTNGQTDWKTADDLGLATDIDLQNAINNLTPGTTIPDGTSSGQILYWNEVAEVWQASALGGYIESLGFTVNNDGGGGFNIIDSMGTCPINAGLKVKVGIFSNMRVIDCASQILITPALMTLSSTSTLITSSNEFKVTSPNAVFTKLVHNAPEPRPVCAETDGDLTLCGNQSTGTWTHSTAGSYTFTVPSGVYELTYSLRGGGGGGGGGGFGKSLYDMGDAFSRVAMAGGGGGGGGGKGEFITGTMQVFPGQQIQVGVGFGGTGGCAISYAGGIACHPYGNSISGQMNGSTGQNGADSFINGPAAGQDFTADGGNGGEGGFSFNPNMSNPATALELGIATPGGDGGSDWDGDVNSFGGDFGQIRHEFSGQSIIDDSNYDGGQPDHPNPPGAGNSSTGSCLRQNTIAYGGDGGEGSGGTAGGGGGNAYTHGSFEPSTCDLGSNSYLTIGAGAWGDNGGDATDGTGNGGGGGGGGSSIAAPYPWTDTGTTYVGKGGIGGDGGDGYVYFSW